MSAVTKVIENAARTVDPESEEPKASYLFFRCLKQAVGYWGWRGWRGSVLFSQAGVDN